MDKNEKILLIQLLLEDIRGNWGWENGSNKRDVLAKELAMSLINEVDGMDQLTDSIQDYDREDGRYFRCKYPNGYIGMSDLHGLGNTLWDKSKEFRDLAFQYLTYPDTCFEDFNE